MGGKMMSGRAHRGDFGEVFAQLCTMAREHGRQLDVDTETPTELILTGPVMEKWNKRLWFGGAKIGKAYVSYHLMPVYMYPDLLEDISPTLKARMQGKSCFNFKRLDSDVFKELDELTARSVQRLRAEGILD